MQFITFSVGESLCALELAHVERIVMAVALLPIPASEVSNEKCGMVNVAGDVLPVVNIRGLLGLPKRDAELSDFFIIANFSGERIVLWAEAITGVKEFDDSQVVPASPYFSGSSHIDRVIKDGPNMLLVWNFAGILAEV